MSEDARTLLEAYWERRLDLADSYWPAVRRSGVKEFFNLSWRSERFARAASEIAAAGFGTVGKARGSTTLEVDLVKAGLLLHPPAVPGDWSDYDLAVLNGDLIQRDRVVPFDWASKHLHRTKEEIKMKGDTLGIIWSFLPGGPEAIRRAEQAAELAAWPPEDRVALQRICARLGDYEQKRLYRDLGVTYCPAAKPAESTPQPAQKLDGSQPASEAPSQTEAETAESHLKVTQKSPESRHEDVGCPAG